MERIKKSVFLTAKAIALIFCITLVGILSGCNGSGEGSDVESENTAYSILVNSEGGLPLSKINVYVYKDSTQTSLLYAAETDKNGFISFEAENSNNYVAVLKGLPDGYEAEASYSVSANTVITPKTVLSDSGDLKGYTYKLGSVIRDFSVTAINGETYKVSEILKEKKALVLNFWFINCGPCRMEFPYMQKAYDEYREDIELLAMNPVDGSEDRIASYANEMSLTLPMASVDAEWDSCMQIIGYPTTVVIDRYGTICMIHAGSITDENVFMEIFEYFTADDYKQTLVKNIGDILKK